MTFDSRWRERHFGTQVPLTVEDALTQYPAVFDYEGGGFFDAKTEHGESWADVDRRIADALEEILNSGDGHVVVFAHGGPIMLVMCRLLNLNPLTHWWRYTVENTAIAMFEESRSPTALGSHIVLAGWNDVSHLPVELRTGAT